MGEFEVLRSQRFNSVGEALEWLGFGVFVPGAPSLDDALGVYFKLFTGRTAVKGEASRWDECNRGKTDGGAGRFVAWEDRHVRHYIVHPDGRDPWSYPQEAARAPGKQAGEEMPAVPVFRGWSFPVGKQNVALYDASNAVFVLNTATRNATKRRRGEQLAVTPGTTAFEV